MSLETLAAGQQMGQDVAAAVVGHSVDALAGELSRKKLARVYSVNHELLAQYTADGFSEADHVALCDTFKALTAKGVKAVLSNSDVPLVRELYKDYKIETIQANRVINVDPTKRGKINEVMVLNF